MMINYWCPVLYESLDYLFLQRLGGGGSSRTFDILIIDLNRSTDLRWLLMYGAIWILRWSFFAFVLSRLVRYWSLVCLFFCQIYQISAHINYVNWFNSRYICPGCFPHDPVNCLPLHCPLQVSSSDILNSNGFP